eukprot:g3732.t1
MTYGEMSTESFLDILVAQFAGKAMGSMTFLDIGSGMGKIVLLASLFFKQAVGVELSQTLYEQSKYALKSFSASMADAVEESQGAAVIVHGDMFDVDWSFADVIYACTTCFGDSMCERVARKAARELRPGSMILSVTRPLVHESLDRVAVIDCRFSWGLRYTTNSSFFTFLKMLVL